ncbi:MAG: hypothetical protein JW734_03080 [Candidatus Omnitrophica bacterium]|nr:hypothetical protein [Candidatus Omnitrophota bacterium]
MKPLIYLVFLIFLFFFVFFASNTWQTEHSTETREGIEYVVTRHSLDWDNFFDYLKDLPRNIRLRLPTR